MNIANRLSTNKLEQYRKNNRLLHFDPIRGYRKNEVNRIGTDEIEWNGNDYYRTYTHNNAEVWVKRKTEKKQTLTCGCCGDYFRTWDGYTDQGQDKGYGICKSCQTDIAEDDKRQMDKAIKLIKDALNRKNSKHFSSMPRIQQEYVVLQAIDNGIMNFKIRRQQ